MLKKEPELQYILPLTILIMKEKYSNSNPYYLVDIRPSPAVDIAVMLMISLKKYILLVSCSIPCIPQCATTGPECKGARVSSELKYPARVLKLAKTKRNLCSRLVEVG